MIGKIQVKISDYVLLNQCFGDLIKNPTQVFVDKLGAFRLFHNVKFKPNKPCTAIAYAFCALNAFQLVPVCYQNVQRSVPTALRSIDFNVFLAVFFKIAVKGIGEFLGVLFYVILLVIAG